MNTPEKPTGMSFDELAVFNQENVQGGEGVDIGAIMGEHEPDEKVIPVGMDQ
jgi:hypothetical protein